MIKRVKAVYIGFLLIASIPLLSHALVSEIPDADDKEDIYGYEMSNNVLLHINESLRYTSFDQNFAADRELYFARLLNNDPVIEAKLQQNLGIIALKRKQPQQAFLFFQRAATLMPDDYGAYVFGLDAFCQQIGIQNTEALFTHNYEENPMNPQSIFVLAVLYQKQNRLNDAIRFYQAYIALSPNSSLRQSADNALLNLQTAREALVKAPYSQIR